MMMMMMAITIMGATTFTGLPIDHNDDDDDDYDYDADDHGRHHINRASHRPKLSWKSHLQNSIPVIFVGILVNGYP